MEVVIGTSIGTLLFGFTESKISTEDLLAIAQSQVDEVTHKQHVALLEKHKTEDLTADEQLRLTRISDDLRSHSCQHLVR